MSEIEKMYENANVKQNRMCEWTCKDGEDCSTNCEHYESTQLYYPPFTAEKQLELIKLLLKYDHLTLWYFPPNENSYNFDLGLRNSSAKSFKECLAKLTNDLWQDLTEAEKQQVKGILE